MNGAVGRTMMLGKLRKVNIVREVSSGFTFTYNISTWELCRSPYIGNPFEQWYRQKSINKILRRREG
jgi:hypothetical protein